MINLNKGQYIVALENLFTLNNTTYAINKNQVCELVDNKAIISGFSNHHTIDGSGFRQATQKEIDDYLKGKVFVDDVELEEVIIISTLDQVDLTDKITTWINQNHHDEIFIKEIKLFELTHENSYQAKVIYQILK